MAVEKIMGGGGLSSDVRPAARISVARVAQALRRSQNLVVLTGAGISAESGIPTFRGADGFWTVGSKHYQPQELATWEKYNEMPAELWRWYQYRWGICRKAQPNPGHTSLVELQKLVDMTLVTQNVDGLHQQSGFDISKLCEIHGRIDEMRCDERLEGACLYKMDLNDPANLERARATVMMTPTPAKDEAEERLPMCPQCGQRQRPKILWFDESYNEAFFKWKTVMEQMDKCDVLLIIGTQLTTGGPRSMVRAAQSSGALIIRIDPEVDLKDDATAGMLHLQGKSGEVLPGLVREVARLCKEPLLAPLKAPGPASGAHVESSSASASPVLSRTATRGTSTPASTRKSMAPRAPSPGMKTSAASAPRAPSPGMKSSARASASAASASQLTSSPPTAPPRRKGRAASEQGQLPVGFFVYGTLRPDDDSGASWTKSFSEGLEAEVAYLPGASLYIDGRYPAVCFEDTSCSVKGMLLKPASSAPLTLLASKLTEADNIEGYPDLYSRTVATVLNENGVASPAYVYHRTGKFERSCSLRIADGDWLSRVRSSALPKE